MKKDTNIYDICKEHMHAYVLAEMTDGTQVDGIITGLDENHVYFAVPMGCSDGHDGQERQFGGYGYGYPGYGGYGGFDPGYGYGGYGGFDPGFGYGAYPGQRFRRLVLPLAAIAAISLLPWY